MKCNSCLMELNDCICAEIDAFFEENRESLRDFQELQAYTEGKKKRCLGCYNFICRCKQGHYERLKK